MGWRPDLPDARDFKFKALRAGAEPLSQTRVDLAPKLRKQGLLPMDQGMLGSCVGCSTGMLHAFVRDVTRRSELQIYYEARRLINETGIDQGAYIRDGIKVISTLGAGRDNWWPYDESKVFEDPTPSVDRDALLRRVFTYYRLETREDFHHCLCEGFPFVIGFTCYTSIFMEDCSVFGILPYPDLSREYAEGGHAILVIGVDTDFRNSQWAKVAVANGYPAAKVPAEVYICQNSWGTGWGHDGYVAIDARIFENRDLSDDAWTVRR